MGEEESEEGVRRGEGMWQKRSEKATPRRHLSRLDGGGGAGYVQWSSVLGRGNRKCEDSSQECAWCACVCVCV